MTHPALPREIGIAEQDIHALFLYLQRSKDSFEDSVSSVSTTSANYTDEKAQDAVGTIGQSTSSVNFIYNDAVPSLTWSVQPNSTVQKITVLQDGGVIGTRSKLNFLNSQLTLVDDAISDEVDITLPSAFSRLVATGITVTLKHSESLVVSRYFEVQGTLSFQGDACLEVL